MQSDRLAFLSDVVQKNPGESFARYGFAMELVRLGRLEDAVREFRELLRRDPNYAAAYYHGGQTLEKLGRTDEAQDLYRQGIDVTGRTGDLHTQSELAAALSLIE